MTVITVLLFLTNLTGAYLDVVVDALMVTSSRIDEDDGSETLQTLSWTALGVGGIFGSLLGGYLTENFHPTVSLLVYSFYGFVVMLLGFLLRSEEKKEESDKFFVDSCIEHVT